MRTSPLMRGVRGVRGAFAFACTFADGVPTRDDGTMRFFSGVLGSGGGATPWSCPCGMGGTGGMFSKPNPLLRSDCERVCVGASLLLLS